MPHTYTDAPRDIPPRRQLLPHVRDADVDGRSRDHPPPARFPPPPSRAGAWFDDGGPARRERNDIDVDSTTRMSSLRLHEGPAKAYSGMYADRPGLDSPVEALPKGPRAMTKANAAAPYLPSGPSPGISPSPSQSSLRSAQPQDPGLLPLPSRSRNRPPAVDPMQEGWSERRDRADYRAPAISPEVRPRRFEDNRNVTYDNTVDRHGRRAESAFEADRQVICSSDLCKDTVSHSFVQNPREPRDTGRFGPRTFDQPSTPLLGSGTNSVPIGSRRGDSRPGSLPPHSPAGRGPLSATERTEPARSYPVREDQGPPAVYDRMVRSPLCA